MSCLDEEPPVCSGRDGLESLAVIAAVLKSAETQAAICPGDMLKEAAEANLRKTQGRSDYVHNAAPIAQHTKLDEKHLSGYSSASTVCDYSADALASEKRSLDASSAHGTSF